MMMAYKNHRDQPEQRTLKLPSATWTAARGRAKKMEIPMREFLDEAVAAEMPRLIEQLRKVGVTGESNPNKVVRVPMSKAVLNQMKRGRNKTGLPGIQLLALCLNRYSARRRRKHV